MTFANVARGRNVPAGADVALRRQGDGTMNPIRHRRKRAAIDATGWVLATTIVVLAVVDLLIWATLWNVPNPVSKLLVPQSMPAAESPLHADPTGPFAASEMPLNRR